jgi:uncharacterized protein YcfJ
MRFGRARFWIIMAALTIVLTGLGCSSQPMTTGEAGTLGGGVLGGGAGALIGAAVGHPLVGALLGGALGAGGGYLVGNSMQSQQAQQAQTQNQIEQQQQEIERQRQELEQLRAQQESE